MVTELAGARLLTPFFGASLYSWAATLSITLLALMSGYYFGGYVTTKPRYNSAVRITSVFICSGLAVLLMPAVGRFIMQRTIGFSFFPGLIISELLFLFPPIFLMGMISPMIIFQITTTAEQSGRSAGNIYAISTFGGILFTLLFGFFIIPYYGISLPVRLLGLIVILIGTGVLLKGKLAGKRVPLLLAVGLVGSVTAFSGSGAGQPASPSNKRLVAFSEGLMGELKVTDELMQGPDGKPVKIRKLRTNNIQQNFVFTDMPKQSLMFYVNFSRQLLRLVPEKRSALLVGLGAGSMYNVLRDQGAAVESVEIDQRIYDMGVNYFGMMPHRENAITDGRYFINTTKKTYDLIFLDVIIGESVPAQLVTLESFKRCFAILSDKGTLVIEHGGISGFSSNAFVPSISKTLQAAGFYVHTFNPMRSKERGDIVFLATKAPFDISRLRIGSDVSIQEGPLREYELPASCFNEAAAMVMTDDENQIDVMLKSHYFGVRKGIRRELAQKKML